MEVAYTDAVLRTGLAHQEARLPVALLCGQMERRVSSKQRARVARRAKVVEQHVQALELIIQRGHVQQTAAAARPALVQGLPQSPFALRLL